MKLITVCGSYKFKKEMLEITEKLALQGNCMLTPIELTKENKEAYTEEELAILGKMHKEKIRLSDAIFVVNVNNYIGSSTDEEIKYAKSLNKEVFYYTDWIKNMEIYNMQVKFYECVDDNLLKFAVIISTSNGKWVFCKHQDRNTYEAPGGRREENETIFECAKRELYEETGAVDFDITPICVYSVTGKNRVNESGEESFGMLYYADIKCFEKELHSEIEKVELFDELPEALTYPLIQPKLIEEATKRGVISYGR